MNFGRKDCRRHNSMLRDFKTLFGKDCQGPNLIHFAVPFWKYLSLIIISIIFVQAIFIIKHPGPFALQQEYIRDYIIGAQDGLMIEVWDHPDLTRQVSVSLTGSFRFPLIGEVKAAGLTTEKVQKEITQRLANGYLVNPQITVTITAYRSKQVNVLGEVQKPGNYPYTRQTSLIEIISMAGGLTDEAGQEAYILHSQEAGYTPPYNERVETRRRQSGKNADCTMEKIDLNDMLQTGQNIFFMLREDDTIYIPRAEFFYVLGEVKSPGQYKLEKGITVLKAISRAGGHTKKANLKKITIIRVAGDKERELHTHLSDPVLPDDIIKIPESFF